MNPFVGNKISNRLLQLVMAPIIELFIAGCEEEGRMEWAGKAVNDAIEDTGDSVEDAHEKVEDAIEDQQTKYYQIITIPPEYLIFVRMFASGRSEPIDSQEMALSKAMIGQAALELSGVTDSERVSAYHLRLDATQTGQPSN